MYSVIVFHFISLHSGFLEHWNSQKSLCNIWQRFSCLLDEGIPKICKKLNSHGGFLSYLQNSTANSAHLAAHFWPQKTLGHMKYWPRIDPTKVGYLETSNFALNSVPRVSKNQKFDAGSNGMLKMIPSTLFTKNLLSDDFFIFFPGKFHTFIVVFCEKKLFSNHCASIWVCHEISFNLRPLDSYLVQNCRFYGIF